MKIKTTGQLIIFNQMVEKGCSSVPCNKQTYSLLLCLKGWRRPRSQALAGVVCLFVFIVLWCFLTYCGAQLNVQTKPVEPLVEGGAQVQQVLNIECITDFSEAPLLNIKFR